MPTVPYYSATGERLPGVTWVIGQNLGWSKDALMKWANREGLAGRDIRGERSVTNVAATIGTAVHAMIEAHIQGWDPVAAAGSSLTDLGEAEQAMAHTSFEGFRRWARNNRITIVATELYGVDPEYKTGFCLDALGLEEQEEGAPLLTLVDWKKTKGTYADHVIQVATYTEFVERALKRGLGLDCRLTGAHVLRVGDGNFKHTFWTRAQLAVAWQAFTWARALHEVRPTIEAMAR